MSELLDDQQGQMVPREDDGSIMAKVKANKWYVLGAVALIGFAIYWFYFKKSGKSEVSLTSTDSPSKVKVHRMR
jgi:hypothetical protein